MAFNPFILQRTDPEAVQSRFLMTTLGTLSRSRQRFRLSSEKRPQRAMSPAQCFDIFSPPPGDSDVISQVERLSSIERK
jgi:hypothetical protein